MWDKWVIDCSMHEPGMPYVYCPVEFGDDGEISNVVVGMMLMGKPKGDVVGVYHQDGQEAVERWCAANPEWRTPESDALVK